MQKIFSKTHPNKLLHIIVRKQDAINGRIDLIPPNNFIQCSIMKLENNKTFRPHKHLWKPRKRDIIAQESWLVIQGRVKCHFYDLDDTLIEEPILEPGDASFTLEGGHNYTILEEDTLVYEYKTGPYEGQELDKTFIDD